MKKRGRPKKENHEPTFPDEPKEEVEKVVDKKLGESMEPKSLEPAEVSGTKIYWAPSKKYTLFLSKKDPEIVGNYQREKRDNSGGMAQVAIPIMFGEHVFATNDLDEQKVVEGSSAFETGEIKPCATMGEADQMTAAQDLERSSTSGMVTMASDTSSIRTMDDAQAAGLKPAESTAG